MKNLSQHLPELTHFIFNFSQNPNNVDRSTDAVIDSVADELQARTTESLEDLKKSIRPMLIVTTRESDLKVRNEQGKDTGLRVQRGSRVKFLGEIKTSFDTSGNETGKSSENREHLWFKVEYGAGQTGWVSAEYLSGEVGTTNQNENSSETVIVNPTNNNETVVVDQNQETEEVVENPVVIINPTEEENETGETITEAGIRLRKFIEEDEIVALDDLSQNLFTPDSAIYVDGRKTPYSLAEVKAMEGDYKIVQFGVGKDGSAWKIKILGLQKVTSVVIDDDDQDVVDDNVEETETIATTRLRGRIESNGKLVVANLSEELFTSDRVISADGAKHNRTLDEIRALPGELRITDFKIKKENGVWKISQLSLETIREINPERTETYTAMSKTDLETVKTKTTEVIVDGIVNDGTDGILPNGEKLDTEFLVVKMVATGEQFPVFIAKGTDGNWTTFETRSRNDHTLVISHKVYYDEATNSLKKLLFREKITFDTKTPSSIQTEVKANVTTLQNLSEGQEVVFPNAKYKKLGSEIYYNSNPDNTWGKLSDAEPWYVASGDKMLECQEEAVNGVLSFNGLGLLISKTSAQIFDQTGKSMEEKTGNNVKFYKFPGKNFYVKSTGTGWKQCESDGRNIESMKEKPVDILDEAEMNKIVSTTITPIGFKIDTGKQTPPVCGCESGDYVFPGKTKAQFVDYAIRIIEDGQTKFLVFSKDKGTVYELNHAANPKKAVPRNDFRLSGEKLEKLNQPKTSLIKVEKLDNNKTTIIKDVDLTKTVSMNMTYADFQKLSNKEDYIFISGPLVHGITKKNENGEDVLDHYTTYTGGVINNGLVQKPFVKSSNEGGNFADNNGIVFIGSDGKMKLYTETEFSTLPSSEKSKARLAFQNGPILLNNGKNPHDAQNTDPKKKTKRLGMGCDSNGNVKFIYSDVPMNLYEFGEKMRASGCVNAMFLDGKDDRAIGYSVGSDVNSVLDSRRGLVIKK